MITTALILAFLLITALLATGTGWSNVLSTDRNELVFAGRNQAYGAYRMRQEHHRTMFFALLAGLGFVGAVALLPTLFRGEPIAAPPSPGKVVVDLVFPPTPLEAVKPKSASKPTPVPPAPKPAAPVKTTGPLIAVDSARTTIEDTTRTTSLPSSSPGGGTSTSTGPGTGATTDGEADGDDPKPIWELEKLPEYPGGEAAMHRYLIREIRYPNDAVDARLEGRVTVGFIIRADGSVTDVKVLKGLSPTIDAEAERVVRRMIKWIPGKFNKREVDVRYALPIVFRLSN